MTNAPAPAPFSAHQRGVLLLVASTIAWSTAGLFVRMFSIDAISSIVWRGPAGAIAIFAFMVWVGGFRNACASFRRMGWIAWVYAAISAAAMLFYIPALQLTTIAHVAIIYATVPFVAAALGYIVAGDKPGASAMIASFVALAGVVVMVSNHETGSRMSGDLLALAMTFSAAGLMVISRRHLDIPFLPAASASCLLAALIAVPFATELPANAAQYAVISLSGVINSALGFGLFVLGSRLVPAVETALIGSLEAPLAPLWVWLAFGETPSIATLAGGSLVTLAVLGHLNVSGRRA